ncbi:MAG: T9SS type A sorting domain-containing protein [Saprospiraceae bacterium]|nr:T9SS type A sorting domain-containing protein [Saprospiraceae bacterium]
MFISPNTFFAISTVDFVSPPSTAEIGIPFTLNVAVTLDSGSTVTSYRWECGFLGSPFDQSPYIPGWFDYQSSGYEYASSSTVSSVNVQFGSFFDATTKKIVEVFVAYTDKYGNPQTISKTAEIEVPRICPPNIGGDLEVPSFFTVDPPPPCEDPLPIKGKQDTLKELIVLRDIKLSESLISPNPFQTELNIVFEEPFTGDISIINMQGGEIYHCQLKDVTEKQLNVGNQLSKGIYFLIQRGGNEASIHKIIKI